MTQDQKPKHTPGPWRRNDGPTHPKTQPGDIEIVENDLPSKIILTVHQQYSPVPDRGYGASLEPDDVTTNANADLALSAPTRQAEIEQLKKEKEKLHRVINKVEAHRDSYRKDLNIAQAHVERLREGIAAQSKAVEELFAELGNERAGNWGIINDGLQQASAARAETEPEKLTGEALERAQFRVNHGNNEGNK